MRDVIYFDNAATTFPKPQAVIDGMSECMRESCGNPGRGSHPLAVSASEILYECREFAAEMFSADSPDNVVLVQNTTHALNLAMKSYIPEGSHILISDMEHNAVLRPAEAMMRYGRITYDVFPTQGNTAQIISGITERIKSNTAAVVCTLASNICPWRIPSREIGRLCRSRGLMYIADGAQAAGHRRISMKDEDIDVLCVPGHKGLYGPQGIGMMISFIDKPGETLIEGGSGTDSLSPVMPEYLPDRYEAGTVNTPGAAGLLAGMKFVAETGIGNIEKAERELWYRLYSGICGDRRFEIYGGRFPSSVMLVNKRGRDPSEVSGYLAKRGICTRSGFHCAPLAHKTIGTGERGGVRISFGVFNTMKEVDALCDALFRA